MWVITRSINDYHQHGDYFVACFAKKPSFEEFLRVYIKSVGILSLDSIPLKRVKHYYDNKGRFAYEDEWYYLFEIKEGELYEEK